MNPRMWLNPATRRNVALLEADGVALRRSRRRRDGRARRGRPRPLRRCRSCSSDRGLLATPIAPARSLEQGRGRSPRPLAGRHVLVTAGPTHEPIDPVRYIANRSSGKQGAAIAARPRALGAASRSSPARRRRRPPGVQVVEVETAREMLAAVQAALPADIAIFAAAVADWRVATPGGEKIKKGGKGAPRLELIENPDILETIAAERAGRRPPLVIGFAAETENVLENATAKRKAKGADWIVANDVSPADRHHGRRPQHRASRHRGRRGELARAGQGRGGAAADAARSRAAGRDHRRD